MGNDDPIRSLCGVGIERDDQSQTDEAADDLHGDEWEHRGGAIPPNVSENVRPTVTSGFANDVELVNQYAAPMYAPTAAADNAARPVLASVKINAINPAVATTSPTRWPVVNRSLVEISIAALSYMTFARTAAKIPPAV